MPLYLPEAALPLDESADQDSVDQECLPDDLNRQVKLFEWPHLIEDKQRTALS